MVIDGRGKGFREPYDALERLLTREACLLGDSVEVLVDREAHARKINVLAVMAGYETALEPAEGYWVLRVDTRTKRCF